MAVVDVAPAPSVSSTQALANLRDLFTRGANIGALWTSVSVAAADDDGSIYRVFTNLKPTLRPLMIMVGNTAMTAGTGYDLGLYVTGVGGAAILDNVFATAMDLSAAHASMNPKTALDGMANVLAVSQSKQLYEHAGDTSATARDGYDVALTADTVGSAAGTVDVLMIYALG